MNYITGIKLKELPEGEDYLRELPAVKYLYNMGELELSRPVTFFIGENGTGKSTLLEAIAVAAGFNAEGGSRDFSFATRRTHSELCDHITIVRTIPPKDGFFLRAESFYNTASYLDENSTMLRYGGVSFHAQSHGEAFMSLMTNRFEGRGLYIMDEPEAALSPMRLMALIAEMGRLVRSDSQLIIATHSPILMAFPGAQVMLIDENGINEVNYRETEHYRITRRMLENPDSLLSELLDE